MQIPLVRANHKQLVAIVIPIYKKTPSPAECVSLKQCIFVLNKYPIIFLAPKSLDTTFYEEICSNKVSYIFERVEDEFFRSTDSYSLLLCSQYFYERFVKFKYILLYQLDAYVFFDELKYWCQNDYDYIGAPWFEGFDNPVEGAKLCGVGNGGFSLRKVSTFIRINNKIKLITFAGNLIERFLPRNKMGLTFFLKVLCGLMNLKYSHYFLDVYEKKPMNEDYYWCEIIPQVFGIFNIAPLESAIRFSFEVNPRILFEMNNRQLPFGCHAWTKYDSEFWNLIMSESLSSSKNL